MHNYMPAYTCKFFIEIKLLQLVICITRVFGCSKSHILILEKHNEVGRRKNSWASCKGVDKQIHELRDWYPNGPCWSSCLLWLIPLYLFPCHSFTTCNVQIKWRFTFTTTYPWVSSTTYIQMFGILSTYPIPIK